MENTYTDFDDITIFEKVTPADLDPARSAYEDCRFIGCNFHSAKFNGLAFRNCVFENCDLSLATVRDTALQEVRFLHCKLLGIEFNACRKFLLNMAFEHCVIRLSTFIGMSLKGTIFEECDLQEADFSNADLSGAGFAHCSLSRTTFFRSNLEKADFRSAFGYSFAPDANRMSKAKFSMPEVLGLLDSFGIEIE